MEDVQRNERHSNYTGREPSNKEGLLTEGTGE